MKFAKFTVVALLASLFVGCAEGNLSFGDDINGGNAPASNKGQLSIADLAVDCRIDESDPEVGVLSTRATRASVDVSNFDCSIINENNQVIL